MELPVETVAQLKAHLEHCIHHLQEIVGISLLLPGGDQVLSYIAHLQMALDACNGRIEFLTNPDGTPSLPSDVPGVPTPLGTPGYPAPPCEDCNPDPFPQG